ncbi:MAG: 3-isopropylmalate dehydratase large subunit [Alistipes sp.]|nr:3-isopropylmalate dehydratase large subunit [Alistipes sp.]
MNTLFDKIWDAHTVKTLDGGSCVLYIDRQYIHEVTSPQAFAGLRQRGIGVFRPEQVTASPDHNIPTQNQHLPIAEPQSAEQVATLERNCKENGITIFPIGSERNGIIHVIGPQTGLTQPGMTIVCGDSHTSTHGALGCVAFGIGTSEVEMALASQCILQSKPKSMRINVEGELGKGVCSKDIILYIISKLGTGGGTGHFVEFAGSAIRSLSMEARMTICNMSIEMGARGGMIAPDEVTFEYLKGREFAPKGEEWDKAVTYWRTLHSDEDAVFDKEVTFDAADIEPMITYGTNPGMGIAVSGAIPSGEELDAASRASFDKSLAYMGFKAGEKMAGKRVDYVFVGSCTNGRIEDLRAFAHFVKGRKKADGVTAWIVPGSKEVERLAIEEGLRDILTEAGFELRQPGCSACLAMNEDKIPAGKYCVATSNRNFEGRQGPDSRTLLAGPLVAAAAAITGVVTDPRELM